MDYFLSYIQQIDIQTYCKPTTHIYTSWIVLASPILLLHSVRRSTRHFFDTLSTAGSFALTEVWLPDDWNGRVLTVGNGGLAGGGTLRAPSSFGSIPWSEGAGRIVLIYSCQTVTVTELGHVAMPQGCKCGHMSLPHGRQVRSGNELLTVPP